MSVELRAADPKPAYAPHHAGTPLPAVSFRDGIVVMRIRGTLDLPLGFELWEAVRPLLFNAHHIVIDFLNAVELRDSGLVWLITIQGKAQALGMTLEYENVPDRLGPRLRVVTDKT